MPNPSSQPDRPTVADVIGYLGQFDPATQVYRSEDDVPEPGEFITLDSIPLEEWAQEEHPDA